MLAQPGSLALPFFELARDFERLLVVRNGLVVLAQAVVGEPEVVEHKASPCRFLNSR